MVTATPVWAAATTIACTLASLASSTTDVGVQSDVVDIVTADVIDLWIGGKITLGTTPTANTRVEVWAFPSYDGTSFAGGAFGATTAAVSPPSTSFPSGFKGRGVLLDSIPCLVATTGQVLIWGRCGSDVFSCLPPKFVLFFTHNTVAALNATVGNHEVKMRTLNYESA